MALQFTGIHVVARSREPGRGLPCQLRPGGRSWAEGGQPQPTLPAAHADEYLLASACCSQPLQPAVVLYFVAADGAAAGSNHHRSGAGWTAGRVPTVCAGARWLAGWLQ